jgi:phytoene synthase
MDLTVKRYATWRSLEKYCYHAAGVMGLIVGAVLGLTSSGAGAQAVHLGNAIRLTTILCNLKPDWERGTIYLPLEDLVRFRHGEKELGRGVVNGAFRELMRFEVARARELFRLGGDGICWVADDGCRLAASAVAVIYSGLLDAIERQDYDVFARRPRLTTAQRFRLLPAAWRLSRRKHDQPLPARVLGPD